MYPRPPGRRLSIQMICFTCACLVLGAAPTAELRFHFRPGQSLAYTMTMKMDMTSSTGTGSSSSTMDMRMNMRQTVKSVDRDGSAVIRQAVKVSSMTVNGKPYSSPQTSQNLAYTMKMSPIGKIRNISKNGTFSTGIQGFDPTQTQIMGTFPAGPVHVGSQWSSNIDMPKIGRTTLRNTLVSLKPSGRDIVAVIHSVGTADLSRMFAGLSGKANGMKMSGTDDLSLDMTFDVSGGYIERTIATGRMHVDMTIDNPQTGKPTTMTMSGTQLMNMTLAR